MDTRTEHRGWATCVRRWAFFSFVIACSAFAGWRFHAWAVRKGPLDWNTLLHRETATVDASDVADQPLKAQTKVATAKTEFDQQGVPFQNIEGIGKVRHPAATAVYALAYGDRETYMIERPVPVDRNKFRACVAWQAKNLQRTPAGDWAWFYPFDNTYNDVTVTRPWCSGFGQAVGIEALVASYELDGNEDHLKAAERAAQVLFRPIKDGGLLYTRGRDVFFEEFPNDTANPSHVLNGHMRVLLALGHLHRATGNSIYAHWRDRGLETLERWMSLFDAGYWFRYDLNPNKRELGFRLVNRPGTGGQTVAVDAIALTDLQTGRRVLIDVGTKRDNHGPVRLAGMGWSGIRNIDGRTVRFLDCSPATQERPAHDAYCYLSLPGDPTDCLRTNPFELELLIFEQGQDKVDVELRSIAPGKRFRRLDNGTVLSWGEKKWRRVRIPLAASQLGWWVGSEYAHKHAQYLDKLSALRPSLKPWADKAWAYYHAVVPRSDAKWPSDPLKSPSAIRPPAVASRPLPYDIRH